MYKIDKEFENLIPALTKDEFDQLEKNCLENGIQDSVKLWNSIVIDGHNRIKIAEKHNLKLNYYYMDDKFKTRADVISWMLNNQLGRRNINSYQRGVIVLQLEELYKKNVKEKEKARKINNDFDNVVKVDSEKINTRKELSQKANISEGNLNKIQQIEKKATPEVKEKLKNNEITVNKAYQDIKKEERKKEREESIKNVKPIEGKYKIIYADPPWKYNDKQDTNKLGGAEKHYNLMSIEDLCNMPIKEKTEENAVLFLWTTSPLLEDSFKIIKAWGFNYKSSFIWDKVKHNMGHYNSVRHEFLLIGVKGSCTPEKIKLFDSVQSIERTEKHSEKPEEFRNIIDTLYPSGNRIELFSRTKHKNWHVWGNESES